MKKGKKYIHYCWFGDKKMPKLAKKCIKSWKKYLPDYEIVCWNEKNLDLNECGFVKEAYEKKKWAFVADYARAKAIYEYGGIYLDTDMKITKDISFLLEDDSFIGVEDSGAVAVGVWGARQPGDVLAKELLDFYRAQDSFNDKNLYSLAIPVIVTNILQKYGFKKNDHNTQVLDNGLHVYSRDYFYPLSYNYHDNAFSENTCMIHYYDASWASKEERRTIGLIRMFGPKMAGRMIKIAQKIKAMGIYYLKVLWRTIQIITYPLRIILKKILRGKDDDYSGIIDEIKNSKKSYLPFTKENWLGVGASTKAMFGSVVYLPDVNDGKNNYLLVDEIVRNDKIKMIIFSGFAEGWEFLIKEIKNRKPEMIIKVFWHGSNAMHIEEFDWKRFVVMMNLLDNGDLDEVAFAKKSMFEQYKELGYNVSFLPNTFSLDERTKKKIKKTKKSKNLRVGIYFSGDRWVKNFYNQIAAASLIKDAEVDVVPISPRVADYARLLKLNLFGEDNNVSREELWQRIINDDVILHATFVECAPILPLECLELGVPCVTGDNHHYWTGTPLEKYLVEPKADNPVAIAERAKKCIKNRDEIIRLYKKWKVEYDKECEKTVKMFLRLDD